MATEAIELDLRELPPYTAVDWNIFVQNPRIMYNLFEPQSGQGGGKTYYSDKAFDLTSGRQWGKENELKVESVEELHRLTKDLLRMPLLFYCKVEHNRTDNYVVVRVRKRWRNEIAVLVNTQHLGIREVLSRRLSEAMQYMTEGKNFCIKIDFGTSVKQWYSGIVDGEVGFCDGRNHDDNDHMSLFIHNYSTPLSCCMNPLLILFCLPFWLVCGGPCCFVHRKVKCIDVEESIRELPVTLLSGRHQTIIVEHHVGPGPGQPGGQYPFNGPGPRQTAGQYSVNGPGPGQPAGQYSVNGPGPGQPVRQYPLNGPYQAQYASQQYGTNPHIPSVQPQQNRGQNVGQPVQGQNRGPHVVMPAQQGQYNGQMPPPYSV